MLSFWTLAVFGWGDTHYGGEKAAEMVGVGNTHLMAYLIDMQRCEIEKLTGAAYAQLLEVLHWRLSGVQCEQMTEMVWRDSYICRQIRKPQRLLYVFRHEVDYGFNYVCAVDTAVVAYSAGYEAVKPGYGRQKVHQQDTGVCQRVGRIPPFEYCHYFLKQFNPVGYTAVCSGLQGDRRHGWGSKHMGQSAFVVNPVYGPGVGGVGAIAVRQSGRKHETVVRFHLIAPAAYRVPSAARPTIDQNPLGYGFITTAVMAAGGRIVTDIGEVKQSAEWMALHLRDTGRRKHKGPFSYKTVFFANHIWDVAVNSPQR